MALYKIAKITSNDGVELIYLPKAIREALNLRKGRYVKLVVEDGRLVVTLLDL